MVAEVGPPTLLFALFNGVVWVTSNFVGTRKITAPHNTTKQKIDNVGQRKCVWPLQQDGGKESDK